MNTIWRPLVLALSATVLPLLATHSSAAPHLEPCVHYRDYESQVQQLMRQAWHEPLDVLIILYGIWPERGLGITRGEDGAGVIRIEFDESFWYSSYSEVLPGGVQVQDFTKTSVRASTVSIPVSDALADALTKTLQQSADAAREAEPADEITIDGYRYEFLLPDGECLQLSSPPPASQAGKIAELARHLVQGSRSWRTWRNDSVEEQALNLIKQIQ